MKIDFKPLIDCYNRSNFEDMKSKESVLKYWLQKGRLSNYGYEGKEFSKMSAHASKLRAKIRKTEPKKLLDIYNEGKYGILNRLEWIDLGYGLGKEWRYIVGQSFNEEYITLLEIFTGTLKK